MRTVHGYKFMEKRMGINTIFAVGSEIARYLKLVNPEKYGINAPPDFSTAHEEHSLKITGKSLSKAFLLPSISPKKMEKSIYQNYTC